MDFNDQVSKQDLLLTHKPYTKYMLMHNGNMIIVITHTKKINISEITKTFCIIIPIQNCQIINRFKITYFENKIENNIQYYLRAKWKNQLTT